MPMDKKLPHSSDVRRGAKLTGARPLRYDRHGDLIWDDESQELLAALDDLRREIGGR
jgi:hypothetical protein